MISKSESLAWQLYKDGMRVLTFKDGVQDEEIVRFLQTVNQVKLLPTDAADDLRTVLWEQDYLHLTYRFTASDLSIHRYPGGARRPGTFR
jgi:hypothetical protein